MAKGKGGGGGRREQPNINMMGNPERKARDIKGIIAEGKNPGIENPLERKNKAQPRIASDVEARKEELEKGKLAQTPTEPQKNKEDKDKQPFKDYGKDI